jgi:hypothetical protein
MAAARRRRSRLRFVVGTSVVLLVAGAVGAVESRSSASSLTLAPVADAHVREDRPNRNYGAAARLAVDGSPRKVVLLKFDVRGLNGSPVEQAVLRLRTGNASPVGGDLYATDPAWAEHDVTWADAPPANGAPIRSLGPVTAGDWVSVDVTGVVRREGTYAYRLESTSPNGSDYSSREGSTDTRPQLVLTLGPPDAIPPSVAVTSPAPGSTVGGPVVLAADATDDVGVVAVEFRVDGAVVATDPVAPWTATWVASAPGPHLLDAVAVDAAGNRATAAAVTVVAPDDGGPPQAPTGLTAAAATPRRVDLGWSAAADDVAVAGYRVRRDGVELADHSTTTGYVDWAVTPATRYRYEVVAYDAAGHVSAASDPVEIDTPPAVATSLKPQASGLYDRQRLADPAERAAVNGFVVKVGWSALQLTGDGPVEPGNAIDTALATVRELNATDPTLRLRVKLRIYAGGASPDWAKNLDGPPMTICDPSFPSYCETVPRFWTDRFRDAYQRLHDELAARYDAAPEVLEIVVDRCTTIYAEPYIRQGTLAQNLGEYRRAGYTLPLDQRCHRQEIDAHGVWETTRSSVAFNPYQRIDTATEPLRVKSDVDFARSMMHHCRQSLGARCVLGNNSIRDRSGGAAYDALYAEIAALGPPVYFQTATMGRVGDLDATLGWAESQGAGMVELPLGYETALSPSRLAAHDEILESQAAPGG